MQETLKFEYTNLFVASFLKFAENNHFNFFLSFAKSQNTFLMLKFEEQNFKSLQEKLTNSRFTYIKNSQNLNPQTYLEFEGEMIFVDIPSFITGQEQDEMRFLDILRTLQGKEKTFIGITNDNFQAQFYFKDLQSRFNASVCINFENEMNFDFNSIGVDFLYQNGIKIEPEVLEFMLLHIERDMPSFIIFIEELKKFVEVNKKVKKSHIEEIFKNYEKARNKADF